MIRVEAAILINCPVEVVFAFLTDHRNDSRWQEGLLEVQVMPDGPAGMGTHVRAVRKFLGRRAESTMEISEFIPNQREAFRSLAGPLGVSGCTHFEPLGGGTRVTQQMEVHTGGFFALDDGIVEGSLRRNLAAGLNDAKDLLERNFKRAP